MADRAPELNPRDELPLPGARLRESDERVDLFLVSDLSPTLLGPPGTAQGNPPRPLIFIARSQR